MGLPKVLIGTPIYSGKEYCRKEFVNNVNKIDYPNKHFLMVDNSKGNSYLSKLRKEGVNAVKVPRGKNSRDALANAMNYLRRKALDENYDYLMFIESDLFPPKDIVWRLLNHAKPVVGASYFIGLGKNKRLCVFKVVKKPGQLFYGTESLKPGDEKTFLGKGLQRVHGMGVGCTLIHRSVLEKFPFWYSAADDLRENKVMKHPDVYFYMDLWNHSPPIPVFVDSDLVVVHKPSNWAYVRDA